jgi:hypothetical protein
MALTRSWARTGADCADIEVVLDRAAVSPPRVLRFIGARLDEEHQLLARRLVYAGAVSSAARWARTVGSLSISTLVM